MSALPDDANADQAAYWNGEAGRRWTALQDSQDRLFAGLTDALFAAAAPEAGEAVVDVGCGAGDTTIRAAALTGKALGVDVSEPLVARARERAAALGSPARFALADATLHDFSAEAADLMISRFGVMFFADPGKSFANLRRGLRPGGRLAFICWREPKLNPWLMAPYAAAKPLLPPQPTPDRFEPGPFAFADEARVRGILAAAGFKDVSLEPHDNRLDLAGGEGLDVAVERSLAIGPTSRALSDQSPSVVASVRAAVAGALAAYVEDKTVPLMGAIWIVRAGT